MIRVREVCLAGPPEEAGRLLLDQVSLSIRSNEFVCLVGPNGAGKSLLLRVLAGLQRPTAGSIEFDESDSSDSVGLVFQNPDDQIVGSTVERDLAFGLENQGLPSWQIRERVDEALAWSGLEQLAGRPPHLLSEGEKQRLALASALILRPKLLLLDEATSRLDPPGRARFLAAVRAARDAGTAVVQVTHRSEEILAAERVIGLDLGKVVFDGSPADLLGSWHADRLGILWSRLHRLRRRLRERGAVPMGEPGPEWNRVEPIVAAVRA
ncbi:MAG: energy-coupling factor ABC transporter ATP-binding protein [Candidatus Eiseniibacteriota bacterium]